MNELMKSLFKHLNQRGQGAVEYVLLLGLTVAIMLGIILQFNNAFKVWANNYFGDYLTCLLETGELPSLGGGGGSGECTIQPFSLADGGASTGGGSGSGGGGSENEDSNSESSKSPTGARLGGVDGGSNSSTNGGRTGGGQRFAARSKIGGGDDNDEGSSKNGDQTGSGVINRDGYDSSKNGSKRYLVVETEGQKKRRIEEGKKDKIRTKIKTDKNFAEERPGAPTLQRVLKRTPAALTGDDSGLDLSFGNVLRILLIVALILAILLVVGSQIRQVTKSMD